MKQRRMIRGKYDSLWKWEYQIRPWGLDRKIRLRRGCFDTAMNWACRHRGGIKSIQHARNQPWETWRQIG